MGVVVGTFSETKTREHFARWRIGQVNQGAGLCMRGHVMQNGAQDSGTKPVTLPVRRQGDVDDMQSVDARVENEFAHRFVCVFDDKPLRVGMGGAEAAFASAKLHGHQIFEHRRRNAGTFERAGPARAKHGELEGLVLGPGGAQGWGDADGVDVSHARLASPLAFARNLRQIAAVLQ